MICSCTLNFIVITISQESIDRKPIQSCEENKIKNSEKDWIDGNEGNRKGSREWQNKERKENSESQEGTNALMMFHSYQQIGNYVEC